MVLLDCALNFLFFINFIRRMHLIMQSVYISYLIYYEIHLGLIRTIKNVAEFHWHTFRPINICGFAFYAWLLRFTLYANLIMVYKSYSAEKSRLCKYSNKTVRLNIQMAFSDIRNQIKRTLEQILTLFYSLRIIFIFYIFLSSPR